MGKVKKEAIFVKTAEGTDYVKIVGEEKEPQIIEIDPNVFDIWKKSFEESEEYSSVETYTEYPPD